MIDTYISIFYSFMFFFPFSRHFSSTFSRKKTTEYSWISFFSWTKITLLQRKILIYEERHKIWSIRFTKTELSYFISFAFIYFFYHFNINLYLCGCFSMCLSINKWSIYLVLFLHKFFCWHFRSSKSNYFSSDLSTFVEIKWGL